MLMTAAMGEARATEAAMATVRTAALAPTSMRAMAGAMAEARVTAVKIANAVVGVEDSILGLGGCWSEISAGGLSAGMIAYINIACVRLFLPPSLIIIANGHEWLVALFISQGTKKGEVNLLNHMNTVFISPWLVVFQVKKI